MREGTVRGVGLSLVAGYAAFIGWLYVGQPQTIAEVTGGLSASVGLYRIDSQAFEEGLTIFRQDAFAPARAAFERADPARRDAATQFFIAYTYYREGWGRLYSSTWTRIRLSQHDEPSAFHVHLPFDSRSGHPEQRRGVKADTTVRGKRFRT